MHRFEGTEPDQVANTAGAVIAHLEAPRLIRQIGISHELDLARVANAQASLVGEADVRDGQRVESHQLGRDGVDRHLIAASQYDVLDLGIHGPRARAVACRGAIHHGEDTAVDLFLDRQQVDQRFVDPAVRVVSPGIQQPAEGVFHRPGCGRVDVALDGRQVDDVLAEEEIGDVDAFGKDAVQDTHLRLGLDRDPAHVVVFEVVANRDVVTPEDGQVPVQVFALERIGDDRLILNAHQVGEALRAQRADRAFELPRRGVGRREGKVPADVVLENGRGPGRQVLRRVSQVHQALVVVKYAVWPRPKRGYGRFVWHT